MSNKSFISFILFRRHERIRYSVGDLPHTVSVIAVLHIINLQSLQFNKSEDIYLSSNEISCVTIKLNTYQY